MNNRRTARTALYRHFNKYGTLLYVGISLNSIQRTMQHSQGARWFEQIAQITIEWFPSREEAEEAERKAIKAEHPKHNIAHAGDANSAPLPGYAVTHVRSGFRDGWYFQEAEAHHMLGWFRAMFPKDEFVLTRPRFEADSIRDEMWLQWLKWEKWAASPPDFKAADKYDMEAA